MRVRARVGMGLVVLGVPAGLLVVLVLLRGAAHGQQATARPPWALAESDGGIATSDTDAAPATDASAATDAAPDPGIVVVQHPDAGANAGSETARPPAAGVDSRANDGVGEIRLRASDDEPGSASDRPSSYLRPRAGTVPVTIDSDGDALTISIAQAISYRTIASAAGSASLGGFGYGGFGYGGSYGGTYGSSLGFGMGGMYGGPSSTGLGYEPFGLGATAMTYTPICHTPCRLYLRPGTHTLRVGGADRRETDEAVFVPAEGARLRFHSASRAAFSAGQILLWSGGGAALVGVLLLAQSSATMCSGASSCNHWVPAGFLVAGGVALAIGIPLVAMNFTGRVSAGDEARRSARSASRNVWLLGAVPTAHGAHAALALTF